MAPLGGSDPQLELEGGGCGGGLCLRGPSGLLATGTQTCIQSLWVSAELLSVCTPPRFAWAQDVAPTLAAFHEL